MCSRGVQIEGGVGRGDVADQNRCAAGGLAHRGSPAADAGEVHQSRVDLTEFDPASTDLHLIVGSALEVQAVGLKAHQITTAVGAVPAQGGHRRVLLGIFSGVEVARQTYPTDYQFADPAVFDGDARVVDNGQIPAGQRAPDADRADAVEPSSTGHDGGLGRPVGVPHLATVRDQSLGQLWRAGFATEDQQADCLECLGRPQGRKRRHCRDHGDVPRDQPRSQVHPAAHQVTRGRHQTGAMPPGQPHLLTGGVKRDRQSGQHPITRSDRVVLQEHLRLSVDECRRIAVGDGHPLGHPGGPRGEDDPGVVADRRRGGSPTARGTRAADQAGLGDHPGDRSLAEHQRGPLFGVVGVHRHVTRSGGQDREHRHIQRIAARRHPDPDPVAAPDSASGQPPRTLLDVDEHFRIGELYCAVVDPRGVRIAGRGVVENIHQGPRRRGLPGSQIVIGDLGHHHGWES